jgi:uncharacterized lipoprotein YddW (UPF0748 family)
VAGVFLSLLFAAGTVSATSWTPLGLFEGDGAKRAWISEQGPDARPRGNVFEGAPGIRLKCRLDRVEERCFWDVDIPLDLSGATEIRLSIRTTRPTAVSRCSVHFRSGAGWYGGWFSIPKSGWQTIRLQRQAFAPEGSPAGWGAIEGMRISLWQGGGGNTLVSVARMESRCDEIVILRNSAAAEMNPAEMGAVDHAVDRVERWFGDSGITVGRLHDADITNGIPAGCKLVLLPHNPCEVESSTLALMDFVARGGGIIAAYSLPPRLEPVLGLTGHTWSAAGPNEAFAAIRFEGGAADGFPLTMPQDSWNANVPKLGNAEVLGYWQNGAGVTSSLPAVTMNTNGAFIGHVLSSVGREQKIRFLPALAAKLRPDMRGDLAARMLSRAQRLFGLSDWSATRAFILQTAMGPNEGACLDGSALQAIDQYCRDSNTLARHAGFGELINRADVTRNLIQQAYFRAVPNRGGAHEFRGVWCHDAKGVPGRSWHDTATALKQGGFDVLFANMLWAGLAYYPSSLVPVASVVDSQGDLLAECLAACDENDVELHVWKVCWNLQQAPSAFVDTMRSAGRLQQKADGSTRSWLCPSDPRNRDLELSAAVEVVRKYDVAGMHLDYIRYPDADGCYCDGCRKRFATAAAVTITNWPAAVIEGPQRRAFIAWRSTQISSFVEQTAAAIRGVREDIQISAAVFPSWPSCRDTLGQDWVAWATRGDVDFVCPMNYVTDDAEAAALTEEQLAAVAERVPIYPGLGPSTKGLPPEQVVHQVDLVRKAGAKGFVLFELDADLLDIHLPALQLGATAE